MIMKMKWRNYGLQLIFLLRFVTLFLQPECVICLNLPAFLQYLIFLTVHTVFILYFFFSVDICCSWMRLNLKAGLTKLWTLFLVILVHCVIYAINSYLKDTMKYSRHYFNWFLIVLCKMVTKWCCSLVIHLMYYDEY